MADNVTLPGTGSVVATDQVGTDHYQLIKLAFGALDTATLVTASVGFPVGVVGTVPVSGTFWQTTQPVSAASLPLPTGAATETTLGGVLTTSDFDAKAGALTETAPATDTASSGLNGRLQRIAQRLTSLIALIPAALTGSGNFKVSLQESAASQAVTNAGTFATQATQAGTWTVQPGNTANTTAWKVDASSVAVPVTGTFWQATQPVSGTVAATQSGTWNVATVTTVTTVSAVTAITNALPAGTNLLGKVSSGLDTATINNGTTALTPKFAAISTASSGNTTVVAAVTSKKIRVLQFRFQADADVSVKFRDNTAAVDLTGAMATGTKGGGGGAAFCPVGLFETASGNALSINLSGATQVSGSLVYVEV